MIFLALQFLCAQRLGMGRGGRQFRCEFDSRRSHVLIRRRLRGTLAIFQGVQGLHGMDRQFVHGNPSALRPARLFPHRPLRLQNGHNRWIDSGSFRLHFEFILE